MSKKILESDLARYVNAATDLAELVKEAIKEDDCSLLTEEIILALNEFAQAAYEISAVVEALQVDKFKLN